MRGGFGEGARRAGRALAVLASALFSARAAAQGAAQAVEVYIAPLVFLDESAGDRVPPPDAGRTLRELLSDRAFDGRVEVRRLGARGPEAPRSLLEALRLADEYDCPYLFYGYVRRTDDALFLELKLADRDARRVQAVFFSGDAADRWVRLLSDMDAKIAAYFKETLDAGPGRRADEPDYERVWSLPVSAGYWSPAPGSWSGALAGLACARAGVRFRPRMPAWVRGSRKRQAGFGSDLEYALGLGAPGREDAVLHSLLWRISAEYEAELDDRRRIGAGAGPFLRVDVLRQSRKYADAITEFSACPGAGAEVFYAQRLNERLSVGVCLDFDLSLYSEPLISISPRLRMEYRFLPRQGGGDGR